MCAKQAAPFSGLSSLCRSTQGHGLGGSRQMAMNVQLSLEETYADISALRPADATSAFLSIMRGCNNM